MHAHGSHGDVIVVSQVPPKAADAAFEKLSHIALARANVFGLLARAFFDPTGDLVQKLQSGAFVSELHVYFRDLLTQQVHRGEVTDLLYPLEPLHAVQSDLATVDPDTLLKALKVEYARLFIGPGSPEIPPYETFYNPNNSRPLLMVSVEAAAVEKAYHKAGVAITAGLNEPPDHFATEAEFLYFLCGQESDCWSAGDNRGAKKWRRMELDFLEKHLGRWGGDFCQRVETESIHPFYRSAAHFAGAFIKMESTHSTEE
jgi:TorA maturation chaperone TorD